MSDTAAAAADGGELLDSIVREVFNATSNKEELSVKVIKSQVAVKIGRELSKPESQHLKEFVCDLYQKYMDSKQNVRNNTKFILI